MPRFELDDAVRPLVRIGHVAAAPVAVAPTSGSLAAAIETTCDELRREHEGKTAGQIDGLQPARRLYKGFGIDPTKTRPSSEALLRRVIRGDAFPRISNAVDLCNLWAVRSLVPLGLYDANKIDGAVRLRRGAPGESYVGIRKGDVRVEGRPTFVDRRGPFGNPTSDSLRTSVDTDTTSVWMAFIAPAETPDETLGAWVHAAADDMRSFLGPSVETTTGVD